MIAEEPLLFEIGSEDKTAVDFPPQPDAKDCLGTCRKNTKIGLPGLSEPETMRHYTRLSQMNICEDSAFYPLGSCTMKYNPRVNEKLAALPGFSEIHPFQPQNTVQGALEAIYTLSNLLIEITGMKAVSFSPAAGAHGELCGMMTIRAALTHKGNPKEVVLIPESAHGTNPATAAMCGYRIETIPVNNHGLVDIQALQKRLSEGEKNVAAFMLTNPNTCGLFERNIITIANMLHEAGAFFYMDGANFNAIMGIVKPADFGVDAMHINLHKTFSTPHGGGGPGAGPVVFNAELAPFRPLPWIEKDGDLYRLLETNEESMHSFGRMRAFNGQFSILIRALAYILSMGLPGLRQAAEDAVLNANYLRVKLQDILHLPFPGTCMHEVLFDDSSLTETGINTLDIAKSLIDKGYHPMTIYFPLIVHGAMLIEPTETESKRVLDEFVEAIKDIVAKAKSENNQDLKQTPLKAFRKRLDETTAARQPILVHTDDL